MSKYFGFGHQHVLWLYFLGATEGDDSLAAFARATAPRTERLKQRYGQESQPVSSDDEHDDYGELPIILI